MVIVKANFKNLRRLEEYASIMGIGSALLIDTNAIFDCLEEYRRKREYKKCKNSNSFADFETKYSSSMRGMYFHPSERYEDGEDMSRTFKKTRKCIKAARQLLYNLSNWNGDTGYVPVLIDFVLREAGITFNKYGQESYDNYNEWVEKLEDYGTIKNRRRLEGHMEARDSIIIPAVSLKKVPKQYRKAQRKEIKLARRAQRRARAARKAIPPIHLKTPFIYKGKKETRIHYTRLDNDINKRPYCDGTFSHIYNKFTKKKEFTDMAILHTGIVISQETSLEVCILTSDRLFTNSKWNKLPNITAMNPAEFLEHIKTN